VVNGYHQMVITEFIAASTVSLGANAILQATPFTSLASSSNQGGGVVAIVTNQLQMSDNSIISTTAAGFSGGIRQEAGSPCTQCAAPDSCYTPNYYCTSVNNGAQRGASITPYSEDLSVRQYCRGALANGGGGGNDHNAAGGGGANVCATAGTWTGTGVKLIRC